MEQVAGGFGGTGACGSDVETGTGGDDSVDEEQRKCTAKPKLGWDSLWLTDEERGAIAQRIETGDWSFVEIQRMDNRRKHPHIK